MIYSPYDELDEYIDAGASRIARETLLQKGESEEILKKRINDRVLYDSTHPASRTPHQKRYRRAYRLRKRHHEPLLNLH